ncbi:Uma2 family endonuclease [Chondromyces apiculatus]|uniref:Putative restriction endonuclease domain-containing protein n=1 Tax=Chondromyces apiculatus DSM 436 TaxID=1192034 RepID=A0A017T3I2_9BACT|nr:Uma2 family endonuclease [Chondromyces apiculatus]EYF03808.1 Hypothetical protein CAP_5238 [Chondromyces apiculatus DSM 436]
MVWLIHVLSAWVRPRGGFVAGSELKYLLRRGSGRKPDVSVILPGQPPPPRRGAVRRAPDVAIEVVSPTPRDARRDRIEKLREYAAFGVRWYWLLDPAMQTLEIYELGADQRYTWASGASGGRSRTCRDAKGSRWISTRCGWSWTGWGTRCLARATCRTDRAGGRLAWPV